jgi:predicted esterase
MRILIVFSFFWVAPLSALMLNPTGWNQIAPSVSNNNCNTNCNNNYKNAGSSTRRVLISNALFSAVIALQPPLSQAKEIEGQGSMFEINDPETYSGLVYIPKTRSKEEKLLLPVLFVLHGAGKNEQDVWNLANIQAEHAGLIPSLLASGLAPPELYENFIVIAPYSKGKASFYEEPRSKLLQFMRFAISADGGGKQGVDVSRIDLDRKFLFGFSDGATLGVELMTTGKFAGGVFAAYGFTGKLPKLALERLKGIPLWIFHSADDGTFNV